MITAVLFAVAVAATPSLRVAPEGRNGIGVMMGEKWVARDSTVRVVEGTCAEGAQSVTIQTVGGWYRKLGVELAGVGESGCLPATVLSSLESDGSERAERQLKDAFTSRFGPIDAGKISSTPWGHVALPMEHELTPAERELLFQREHLHTAKQRERATDAVGPKRDGVPVYTHFLGADAPLSDRWGSPALVLTLLEVFDEWTTHCRRDLAPALTVARPETCTVQVGDLAWYSDFIPDPLGHRTHFKGNCADIRLFRDDGSRYEAWWNRPDDRPEAAGGYSQALTQAFLSFVTTRFEPSTVYFNDPEVISAVQGVRASRGHDDHIHLCF